ncbi:hypothetical protein ACTU45_10985 [Streptomyces sp. 24-1644]|uniref:hypothetical protein n=1 Tax=Streptomyces sp. 24-1644 TaxID=3457315 RepID=UPI003FA77D5C
MTSHYDSEAHVVIDGEEISVHVTFTVDTVNRRWAGTVDSEHPGFAFKLVNGQRASLRMPDGKTAPITPAGGGQLGTTKARFHGSGMPPV